VQRLVNSPISRSQPGDSATRDRGSEVAPRFPWRAATVRLASVLSFVGSGGHVSLVLDSSQAPVRGCYRAVFPADLVADRWPAPIGGRRTATHGCADVPRLPVFALLAAAARPAPGADRHGRESVVRIRAPQAGRLIPRRCGASARDAPPKYGWWLLGLLEDRVSLATTDIAGAQVPRHAPLRRLRPETDGCESEARRARDILPW
jgi:hypothetical protein